MSDNHISAEDGELSVDVLRDVVISFMIAGRDTTANVIFSSSLV
jgi:cytochrome P450